MAALEFFERFQPHQIAKVYRRVQIGSGGTCQSYCQALFRGSNMEPDSLRRIGDNLASAIVTYMMIAMH